MSLRTIKYRYFKYEQGPYCSFYKIKVDPITGKDIGERISVSYQEWLNN